MSDKIRIITDHKWRDLKYGYELAPKWRKEFTWIDSAEFDLTEFVVYRKWVYPVSEFMALNRGSFTNTPADSPLAAWDGYISDSFFSGVVVRFSRDCEQVQVGRFIS